MNKKMKTKKPILVMGSTLAFLSLAAPVAAHSGTAPTQITDTANQNTDEAQSIPAVKFKTCEYIADQDKTRFSYTVRFGDKPELSRFVLGVDADAEILGASQTYELTDNAPDQKKGLKGLKFEANNKKGGETEVWFDVKGHYNGDSLIDAALDAGSSSWKAKLKGPAREARLTGSSVAVNQNGASAHNNGTGASGSTAAVGVDIKANNPADSKDDKDKDKDKKDKKDKSETGDSVITALTSALQSGKDSITFMVPQNKNNTDMEFIVYKVTNGNRVLLTQFKGNYSAGEHTVDIDTPKDAENYDLEITCKAANDTHTVLWTRSAAGDVWRTVKAGIPTQSTLSVKDNTVLTDVSSTTANGKATISFTVPGGDDKVVDLDFICYKQTDKGRIIFSKINGKYKAGQHTIDVDLPSNDNNYDLEISAMASDNYSVVLWGRQGQGMWKAMKGNDVGLAAIVMQKLQVTTVLTDKDTNTWSWKVGNPTAKDVTLNWRLEGTALNGSQTIKAGEEAILTANTGDNQRLLLNVPGESGYDVNLMPTPITAKSTPSSSTSGSSGSSGSTSSPATNSGNTASPSNNSTGSPSTGGGSSSGSGSPSTGTTGTSTAPSSTSAANSPAQQNQTPAGPAGSAPAATPEASTAGTVTAVADASLTAPSAPSLTQPSAARMSQLPQTGEKAPYSIYGLGALLAMAGAFLLRIKKSRS